MIQVSTSKFIEHIAMHWKSRKLGVKQKSCCYAILLSSAKKKLMY